MTQANFNWFLHTMLFYHTRYVIKKQQQRQQQLEEEEVDEESEAEDVPI
jgi:hypothetical protein